MLVLSRKPGEKLCIGSGISVMVLEAKGNQVRIGITAPDEVGVVREELCKLAAEPVGPRKRRHKELQYENRNP